MMLRLCVIAFFGAGGITLAKEADPVPVPLVPFVLALFLAGVLQAYFVGWWNQPRNPRKWSPRPTWREQQSGVFTGRRRWFDVSIPDARYSIPANRAQLSTEGDSMKARRSLSARR